MLGPPQTVSSCCHTRLSLKNPLSCALQVTPGTHSSEAAVNKQLGDKERVAAALENPNLLDMVERCLATSAY